MAEEAQTIQQKENNIKENIAEKYIGKEDFRDYSKDLLMMINKYDAVIVMARGKYNGKAIDVVMNKMTKHLIQVVDVKLDSEEFLSKKTNKNVNVSSISIKVKLRDGIRK